MVALLTKRRITGLPAGTEITAGLYFTGPIVMVTTMGFSGFAAEAELCPRVENPTTPRAAAVITAEPLNHRTLRMERTEPGSRREVCTKRVCQRRRT